MRQDSGFRMPFRGACGGVLRVPALHSGFTFYTPDWVALHFQGSILRFRERLHVFGRGTPQKCKNQCKNCKVGPLILGGLNPNSKPLWREIVNFHEFFHKGCYYINDAPGKMNLPPAPCFRLPGSGFLTQIGGNGSGAPCI